jgi:hypothetical protein
VPATVPGGTVTVPRETITVSGTVGAVTVSENYIPQITSATLVFWDGYSLILSWLVLETWLVTSSTACTTTGGAEVSRV